MPAHVSSDLFKQQSVVLRSHICVILLLSKDENIVNDLKINLFLICTDFQRSRVNCLL